MTEKEAQRVRADTMRILDILDREAIIPELEAKNKEEVLRELSRALAELHSDIDQEEVLRILLEREKLGSTGLEDGIAIPHGKMESLNRILAVFGRSVEGLDFESIDGSPTHLFFLLMAPENSASANLKALARISRALKDEEFRGKLMGAADGESIFRVIADEDEKL